MSSVECIERMRELADEWRGHLVADLYYEFIDLMENDGLPETLRQIDLCRADAGMTQIEARACEDIYDLLLKVEAQS